MAIATLVVHVIVIAHRIVPIARIVSFLGLVVTFTWHIFISVKAASENIPLCLDPKQRDMKYEA